MNKVLLAILIPGILLSIAVYVVSQETSPALTPGQQRSESQFGALKPGESNSHKIAIDKADQVAICCFWDKGGISFNLYDPNGNLMDSTSGSADFFVGFETVEVPEMFSTASYVLKNNYPTGTYNLTISLDKADTNEIGYVIGIFYEGAELSIETVTNTEHPKTNEPVTITTILKRGSDPVLQAHVLAKIMSPDSTIKILELSDDGNHDDSVADDGRYANIFEIPSLEGLYNVRIETDKTGDNSFSREDYAGLIVNSNRSSIGGIISENTLDTNGDGLYDQLLLSCSLDITKNDQYEIHARLCGGNGGVISDAWIDTLLIQGKQIVNFVFDGDEIYEHGIDGPYVIGDLFLSGTSSIFASLDRAENVYTTKDYTYRDFQHNAIIYTGNQNVKELDVDGDGLIDSLLYYFEVDLVDSDNYKWQGQLHEPESLKPVAFSFNSGPVRAGISSVKLSFSGSAIRKSEIGGPYEVRGVVLYSENHKSPVNNQRFKTKAYNYTDFE